MTIRSALHHVAVFIVAAVLVQAEAAAQEQSAMRPYTSDEWGFVALFPGSPTRSDETTSHGYKSVEFMVEAPSGAAYLVMVTDFNEHLDERVLAGAREGLLKGRKLLSEERIVVAGFPGWEIRLDDGQFLLLARIMIAGTRLYQAIYAASDTAPLGVEFVRSLQPGPR